MKEKIERKWVDSRVVDRYVAKGILGETDYKAYLKALPDDEANAQWVQMDVHDTELGEGGEGLSKDGEGDA